MSVTIETVDDGMLSREDEYDLVMKAKAGCHRATTTLLLSYNPFLVKKAGHYATKFGAQDAFDDILAALKVCFCLRLKTYDPDRGRLASYLDDFYFRDVVGGVLGEQRYPFHLTGHGVKKANRVRRKINRLEAAGIEPTNERIAASLGLQPKTVRLSRRVVNCQQHSLDAPVSDNDERTTGLDQQVDQGPSALEQMNERELVQKTRKALAELAAEQVINGREMLALCGYYGIFAIGGANRTLKDLSEEIGVTPERVRQIRVEAEKKLKGYFEKTEQDRAMLDLLSA